MLHLSTRLTLVVITYRRRRLPIKIIGSYDLTLSSNGVDNHCHGDLTLVITLTVYRRWLPSYRLLDIGQQIQFFHFLQLLLAG